MEEISIFKYVEQLKNTLPNKPLSYFRNHL